MYNRELVARMINAGKIKVIKQYKRRKLISFNEKEYLDCVNCEYYWTLDNFTKCHNRNTYMQICKRCRANDFKKKYHNDIKIHIRQRYKAITRKFDKKNKCSLDEFTHFFMNEIDIYTGRTLKEDFENKHPNKLFQLEVDHIISISEGGTSKIENLQVVPRFINQAKKNGTYEEWKEVLMFFKLP